MRARRVIWLILVLLIAGCYQKGYQQGVQDTVNKIQETTAKVRGTVEGSLLPALTGMVIVFGILKLSGPMIVESMRRSFLAFKLPVGLQVTAAILVWFTASFAAIFYLWETYSIKHAIPALLLVAFSIFPFWFKFLPSLTTEDKEARKLAFSQVTSFFFVIIVVIVIFRLIRDGVGPIGVTPQGTGV